MNKERIKEILKEWEEEGHLRYVQEYKDWFNKNFYLNWTMETQYILNKSYEDAEVPFSYEDLDLFDREGTIDNIIYYFETYENNEDELKKQLDKIEFDLYEVDENSDWESELRDYLYNSTDEDLKEYVEKLQIDYAEKEFYEYIIVSNHAAYWLEQAGATILNENIWCRETTGQAWDMDKVVQKAFILFIKNTL